MENQHKKIKGSNDLSQQEIDAINAVKEVEETVAEILESAMEMPGVDRRWVAIGKTDLQKGFMAVVRGIHPGRFATYPE